MKREPRYLYKFVNGDLSFFYTNVGTDQEFEGDVYTSNQVISHTSPERTQDVSKADVTITVPFDFPVLDLHNPFPAPKKTKVTIYKFYEGVTDPTQCFRGEVLRPRFNKSSAQILCQTRLSSLDKEGLPETHANLCTKFLGDGRCPVNLENFRVGITVSDITGSVYTVTGITQDDDWFKGGKIEAPNGDLRYIISQVGDVLTLDNPFPPETLAELDDADIYPGCDRTFATCSTKYEDETGGGAAHGGVTFMPNDNPHEQGSVSL